MGPLAGLGVGGAVKNGGTLLSVHCDISGNFSREDVLKETGAKDIVSSGEATSGDVSSDKVVDTRSALGLDRELTDRSGVSSHIAR
jgi:hypothetical protein